MARPASGDGGVVRCRQGAEFGSDPQVRLAVAACFSAGLAGAASASEGGFPLTIGNCGATLTLEAPPERVVAVKSSMVELVLALGLGERLVGVAFLDGPVPTQAGPDGAPLAVPELPILSDRVPAQEVVLQTAPDLVLAGWESVLTPSGAGGRDSYAALGIATYVAPVACRSGPDRPDRITFEHVFEQTLQVGRMLGVPERAERLVAEQRAQLATVEPTAGLSALWYSSGTATPFVGGGLGGPQMMLETLGLGNIMADLADSWASVSWEAVAVRDPDVIVLVDASWNTVEQKRQLLAGMPVTRNLAAVAGERYLVIDFAASEPGVRSVPALLDLAEQLDRLRQGARE